MLLMPPGVECRPLILFVWNKLDSAHFGIMDSFGFRGGLLLLRFLCIMVFMSNHDVELQKFTNFYGPSSYNHSCSQSLVDWECNNIIRIIMLLHMPNKLTYLAFYVFNQG